jgi:hypothetical protein
MSDLQKFQNQVTRLKKDFKIRMDALEQQLKDARWEPEKERLQEKIAQLKRIYEPAIWNAEIDQTLAEAKQKKQADEQEAIRAAQRAEVKDHALQEFIKAGGDPSQFESAWPIIEQQILNERVINALVGQQKPTVPIKL